MRVMTMQKVERSLRRCLRELQMRLEREGTYGGSWSGIYELSGDKLRIRFDMTGQHYPKMFFAERGTRQAIEEFVREN